MLALTHSTLRKLFQHVQQQQQQQQQQQNGRSSFLNRKGMSAAKKRREAVIPREADYLRWRRLCEKNVVKEDFDKYGRKLYGHAAESKRVYMASANHTLHVRSYVKLRPLLEEQRSINGGTGELALLECCADGRTIRFARDPDIPEDVAKEVEEAQQHGDIPGATKFVHAFNSARLFDHTVQQQTVFDGFLPSMLDIIMHGGQSCLVLYGERVRGPQPQYAARRSLQDALQQTGIRESGRTAMDAHVQ